MLQTGGGGSGAMDVTHKYGKSGRCYRHADVGSRARDVTEIRR